MIVGQESINKEITRIFDIFRSSKGTIRPHFILTGPSGSGKTYITKELCASKEMPYVEVNAAQITKEGMSGNSLSKCLAPLQRFADLPTIVFVDDEYDVWITDYRIPDAIFRDGKFLVAMYDHDDDFSHYVEIDNVSFWKHVPQPPIEAGEGVES